MLTEDERKELTLIKSVEGFDVIAVPSATYKPRTALSSASGKLALYFCNEFSGFFSIDFIFVIFRTVDWIDFSIQPFKTFDGLVSTLKQRMR